MFSALILICSNLYLSDCTTVSTVIFFSTEAECRTRVETDYKLDYFLRKELNPDGSQKIRNMVDYTCFSWASIKV